MISMYLDLDPTKLTKKDEQMHVVWRHAKEDLVCSFCGVPFDCVLVFIECMERSLQMNCSIHLFSINFENTLRHKNKRCSHCDEKMEKNRSLSVSIFENCLETRDRSCNNNPSSTNTSRTKFQITRSPVRLCSGCFSNCTWKVAKTIDLLLCRM